MSAVTMQSILGYLADVAPSGPVNPWNPGIRRSDFVMLPWARVRSAVNSPQRQEPFRDLDDLRTWWEAGIDIGRAPLRLTADAPGLERLSGLDGLHHAERLLRFGWLFLVGSTDFEGNDRRVFVPLSTAVVELTPASAGSRRPVFEVRPVDSLAPGEGLIDANHSTDLDDALDALAGCGFAAHDETRAPQLSRWLTTDPPSRLIEQWVARFAVAAGIPVPPLLPPDTDPASYSGPPAVSTNPGVWVVRNLDVPNVAGALRTWASQDTTRTALAAVYLPARPDEPPRQGEFRSPLPLNRAQRTVIDRLRSEDVTVVSGPPGTGKSHLVAAAAIAAVAAGDSVLVATQSDYAADVIADLLERHPGPRYVRFGRSEQRESVADDLSGGMAAPYDTKEVRRLLDREATAARRVATLRHRIAAALDTEAALMSGLTDRTLLMAAATQAPGVINPELDWNRIETLATRATATTGLLAGWRRRRAERKLRAAIEARPDATRDDLEAALDAGRAERAIRTGLAGGGLTLDDAWAELERAEAALRDESGRVVEAVRRSRVNSRRHSVQSVAALASALRAGRGRRRRMLRDLQGTDFLDVLPLWLGTLREIDDTLPVEPAIFDLVIFDEASQIDQTRAAPALARAGRAMVVGDPRQLRHVSFVSDEAQRTAAAERDLPSELARILDVRRNSLFDAAAGAAPVTQLDEHFRSIPHLIGFSDSRFYGGRLRLMTQHPGTERRDAIRTIRTAGARDEDGANPAEAEAVVAEVRRAIDDGAGSIGVVSPFRAHADLLEERLIAGFRSDELRRAGVRVGTVHAFQGNERDMIILSLAVGAATPGAALRFIEDPNLFNVMVTRARREIVVVHSLDPTQLPRGLLADYLRYADEPPQPTGPAGRAGGWVGELADALDRHDVPHTPHYPVAGWHVDLAVGAGGRALGVECQPHPDGAETHIERHLALRRAGWDLTDAYVSRWLSRAEDAATHLAEVVLARSISG